MKKQNKSTAPPIEMLYMPKIMGGDNGMITNKALVEYALIEEKKTNILGAESLLLQGSSKEEYAVCAANLMRFYTRQQWSREAQAFFHSLPQAKKTNVSIRLQLGLNLINYGKINDALGHLIYCQSKRPSSAAVLCHLARCYGAQGDINKARQLFESAVQLDPSHIVALREITILCEYEEIHKYRELLYSKLEQPNVPDKQKVTCLFSLAKSCQRMNDTSAEIAFLKKANRLARDTRSGSDLKVQRMFHLQTVLDISRKKIDESRLPFLGKDLVLIVCLPRSGASLLERKISERFGLKQTGENDLYNSAFIEFLRQGNCLSRKAVDIGGLQHFQFNYAEILSSRKKATFIEAYDRVLHDIADGSSALINKSLGNAWQAPFLMKLASNVKVINLTRDPRDVTISALQANFEAGHGYIYSARDLESQIQHHETMLAGWLNQFPKRVISLNYEDFVSNTDDWMAKLGAFLNLAPINTVEQKSVTITSSIWQVQSEVHQASVAKWKKYEPLLEGCFGTSTLNNELKN